MVGELENVGNFNTAIPPRGTAKFSHVSTSSCVKGATLFSNTFLKALGPVFPPETSVNEKDQGKIGVTHLC